jgi:hypothetical protein
MEVSVCKAKVTEDMVGKICLIPTTPDTLDAIAKLGWGEPVVGDLMEEYDNRSKEQLDLYWACCQLVADDYPENRPDRAEWDTKKKVDEQIKIKCRFVDFYCHIYNPKKKDYQINIKTKSISYKALNRIEAGEFFKEAFRKMGEALGISEDELTAEAKNRMKSKRFVCSECGKKAVHKHHLFEQTKQNREFYGKLLDDLRNIKYLCDDCHEWKPVQHISEKEFCELLGIEIRSKTGKL